MNQAPDSGTVARYQTALDGLAARCAEDKSALASEIILGRQDLVKNGIKDETNLTPIGHIASTIPRSGGPVDCRAFLAAYLVLREPA
jgi:hypothetical protein